MRLLNIVVASLLSVTSVLAQQSALPTHAIAGTVTDPQSRPLAGVIVALTNVTEPDVSRLATTDAKGAYRFDEVLPGEYTVTFRADLLSRAYGPSEFPVTRTVEISGAGETRLDVTLRLASPVRPPDGAVAAPAAPKVVCGLTMIPADPALDLKMIVPTPSFVPPAGGAPAPGQATPVKPMIRTVQPGMCWEPAPAVTPGGPVRAR